jgi:hypothetical protein
MPSRLQRGRENGTEMRRGKGREDYKSGKEAGEVDLLPEEIQSFQDKKGEGKW